MQLISLSFCLKKASDEYVGVQRKRIMASPKSVKNAILKSSILRVGFTSQVGRFNANILGILYESMWSSSHDISKLLYG